MWRGISHIHVPALYTAFELRFVAAFPNIVSVRLSRLYLRILLQDDHHSRTSAVSTYHRLAFLFPLISVPVDRSSSVRSQYSLLCVILLRTVYLISDETATYSVLTGTAQWAQPQASRGISSHSLHGVLLQILSMCGGIVKNRHAFSPADIGRLSVDHGGGCQMVTPM